MLADKFISTNALIEDLLNKSFYPAIVKRAIEEAPAVDVVEVVHGEWILQKTPMAFADMLKCSICEYKLCSRVKTNYCPNCGAKMDEEIK